MKERLADLALGTLEFFVIVILLPAILAVEGVKWVEEHL